MQRLIVLASMARSGSTWIGKIFDSHPDTVYRHEPDSEERLRHVPLYPGREDFARHEAALAEFLRTLPRIRSVRVTCKQPFFPKRYHGSTLSLVRQWTARLAKVADAALPGVTVPEFIPPGRYAEHPIVWKSIESVGRLGLVARAAPRATVFQLLRHPCGYVASVLRGQRKGRFDDNENATDDPEIFEWLAATEVARDFGLDAGRLLALPPAERLAWRWTIENEKALRDTAALPHCHVIRYEDFCVDPLGATRRALGLAGLDMHPQVERFLTASTARESRAYYSVFKDPLRASLRWREELDPGTVARVLSIASHSGAGRRYGVGSAIEENVPPPAELATA